ncbi:hypothetical protein OTU49_017141, partial [Cherax quadricarinatus]
MREEKEVLPSLSYRRRLLQGGAERVVEMVMGVCPFTPEEVLEGELLLQALLAPSQSSLSPMNLSQTTISSLGPSSVALSLLDPTQLLLSGNDPYCFVEFADRQSAEHALHTMNKRLCLGK